MDKQKEIEAIGNIIFENIKIPIKYDENIVQTIPIFLADKAAKKIIEAGYGDTKAAVKEFVEKLKKEHGNVYRCVCVSFESLDYLVKESNNADNG